MLCVHETLTCALSLSRNQIVSYCSPFFHQFKSTQHVHVTAYSSGGNLSDPRMVLFPFVLRCGNVFRTVKLIEDKNSIHSITGQ